MESLGHFRNYGRRGKLRKDVKKRRGSKRKLMNSAFIRERSVGSPGGTGERADKTWRIGTTRRAWTGGIVSQHNGRT